MNKGLDISQVKSHHADIKLLYSYIIIVLADFCPVFFCSLYGELKQKNALCC